MLLNGNDGTLHGNDISIVSSKGRNSRIIKAATISIKSDGAFTNTGGEHDGLMLIDKNQPEGLWGIHGDIIKLDIRTLANESQGVIWASKRIEGNFIECHNKGYIRCLVDVSIASRTYIDQAHAVQRRTRSGVTQHTKASLVAYRSLALKVSDGTIQSAIYGEQAVALSGRGGVNDKLKNSGIISSPGVLSIENLKLVNSGKIKIESRITGETRTTLENKGDVESISVKIHNLEQLKIGTFNCQELTLQHGDIAGLVSAKKWIEVGGDINGRGVLKSHGVVRLAERIRNDISVQCKIEAKDIYLVTSYGLTLGQIVGERASITASYFDVPSHYLNDGSESIKLKSLSVTVDDHERINIRLPLSVSDAQLTLTAKQVTLGHVHAPLGLKLTAEKVFLNGDIADATAKNLGLSNVKELNIAGNFIAPSVIFSLPVETLVVEPTGRLDVKIFNLDTTGHGISNLIRMGRNLKEVRIHGAVNVSEWFDMRDRYDVRLLIKGSNTQKAIVSAKGG